LKNYRKAHLWGGDERNNWSFGHVYPEEGEAYSVFEVNGLRVGVLNYYEAEFPELTRILALKGAQLVVIPTAADEYTVLRTGELTKTTYPDVQFLIRSNFARSIPTRIRFIVDSFSPVTGGKHIQFGTLMPFRGGGVHPIGLGRLLPLAGYPAAWSILNGRNRSAAQAAAIADKARCP